MEHERILAEVELERKTVEEAIRDGIAELGLSSRDEVDVEVISEGKPGFLGLGREFAKVVVRRKAPKKSTKKRRRSRRGTRSSSSKEGSQRPEKSSSKAGTEAKSKDDRSPKRKPDAGSRTENQGRSDRRPPKKESAKVTSEGEERADISTQAEVAVDFLKGLLEAFGLEGAVNHRIDDEILFLDVSGEQTEALVGPRGSIMDSVLELTRTVIQRRTFGAPRMRLDIAGYGERRREALRIYTGKLAERVLSEGGEVMLEPMNAADRKAVHDAVADIDGIRSFSEGEDPHRAVVIAPDEAE
jgi:spoIIIJ-associated protein